MFCPQCGAEYREGFYTCSDCNVPLVNQLPPEPETKYIDQDELVTVMETKDAQLVRIAASWLESADIFYLVNGKSFREWELETSRTVPEKTFSLQVEKNEVENVKNLLSDIETNQIVEDIPVESPVINTVIVPNKKENMIIDLQDNESLSSAKAIFRTLVVADIVFLFLFAKLSASMSESLPVTMKDYLGTLCYSQTMCSAAHDIHYPSIFLNVMAAFALMTLWGHARLLYILSWLLVLIATFSSPGQISHGAPLLCGIIAVMIGGAIIAAMYLPPINKAFRQ